MPRVAGFLRVIRRRDRWGRPVDPDYGIDEGELEGGPDTGFNPDYPDQGFNPDYPDQGGPGGRPGRPERPGHLPGWGRPERPERPERPGRPGNRPPGSWGGRPVDPGYGVDEGGGDHIWPFPPGSGLPPAPGQPLPPVDPPPGTIWPPLPPDIDVHGKLLLLAWIPGVGNRWIIVNVPEPPAGGIGGRPPDRPGPTPPGPTPKL
jgi:hypothetical protein